jgi:hypothetical protein
MSSQRKRDHTVVLKTTKKSFSVKILVYLNIYMHENKYCLSFQL